MGIGQKPANGSGLTLPSRRPVRTARHLTVAVALVALVVMLAGSPSQAAEIRPITFPVIGSVSYTDTFGAPRGDGRTHEGQDLMGRKMQQLVGAVEGRVSYITLTQPSWGWSIWIKDSAGYEYRYLHVNNDTPGTDDGQGGFNNAFPRPWRVGDLVRAGELVAWMGDSGNAEASSPHLHFEIRRPDGTAMNPYDSLQAAPRLSAPVGQFQPRLGDLAPLDAFSGGATVAACDTVGDGRKEVVTGSGPGGQPKVVIEGADGSDVRSFMAYDPAFAGGVDVACGDLDGRPGDEVVVAPGRGGGPNIRTFNGRGGLVSSFWGFTPSDTWGVRVAVGDVDGDTRNEVVVAPGPNMGPDVKVYEQAGTLLRTITVYDPAFKGGVDVTVADVQPGGKSELVVSPGAGGGPNVKVWTASGANLASWWAFDPRFQGGVKVAAGEVLGTRAGLELLIAPGQGGGPTVRTTDGSGNDLAPTFFGVESWFGGGIDVGGGPTGGYLATGPTAPVLVRVIPLRPTV